ncbi:MAG: CopD family protein [Pseudomonadales bacterium]|nr:CopD family protein [Pseudomonadales bacterium]
MEWLILLMAFVHDLSVAVYLGGAVAMEFILAPAQSSIPPAQAQVMGEKTSNRFLILVWISLILLFITGAFRLYFKGMLFGTQSIFVPPLTLDYSYGQTVFALFIVWLILMINGAIITFVLRPKLTGKMTAGVSKAQADQSSAGKMSAATWIERLTRADLVLAIVATLLGASLLRGGLF